MKMLLTLLTLITNSFLLPPKSICLSAYTPGVIKNEIHFIGSTPGDDLIKEQLGIEAEIKIDFIRWDLKLREKSNFVLNINYGENQPNTLGFTGGGQTKDYHGTYTILKHENMEIYQFKSNKLKLAMMRLSHNLFHILTAENKLMVGNGGWSYTLNNKFPTKDEIKLPTLSGFNKSANDHQAQLIFDGRTPCQEFATEHQMKVSQACFKLKWKLTLNRNPFNFQPTTYSIRKVVDNAPKDITGTWAITKGTESNPDAIIYQLDPDKPNQTISLLVGDENILYFLHKDKALFVGNGDFSFTLNKRSQ
ncbi:MAG: hypothetical protein KA143_10820 [Saprospiraceae bacterium]|nr:hypothetical protein [Saprospiraceae bacterium]